MTALFVTGIGTEIGKTFLSAALLHAWRRQGLCPGVAKPVLSGFDASAWQGCDTAILLRAAGQRVSLDAVRQATPLLFKAALAPDMAAAREGQRLTRDAVLAACRVALASPARPFLLEGAGGVMSPIAEDATVLDIMAALGLPALLVGGSYLGAISHALTALGMLRAHGVPVLALALSESEASIGLAETMAAIARFAPEVPIFAVPRLASPAAAGADPSTQALARLISAPGLGAASRSLGNDPSPL